MYYNPNLEFSAGPPSSSEDKIPFFQILPNPALLILAMISSCMDYFFHLLIGPPLFMQLVLVIPSPFSTWQLV